MKYVDADKIAEALGKMPTWPDLDVRGESGYTPCCSTDECEDNVPNWKLKEAEMIYEKEVKKEEETMRTAIPSTVGVVQRKNTTVVNWDDGVKTVVTLKEEDCPDKMFVGFCIAYTKRMLGGTTKLLETIERCDTDKQIRFAKEMEKNFRKQRDLDRKEVDHIRREREFNKMVENELMHMRAVEEAKKRHKDYIRSHKEK